MFLLDLAKDVLALFTAVMAFAMGEEDPTKTGEGPKKRSAVTAAFREVLQDFPSGIITTFLLKNLSTDQLEWLIGILINLAVIVLKKTGLFRSGGTGTSTSPLVSGGSSSTPPLSPNP